MVPDPRVTNESMRELRWVVADLLMVLAEKLCTWAFRLQDDRPWTTTPGQWEKRR